jgi:hypothetical protein
VQLVSGFELRHLLGGVETTALLAAKDARIVALEARVKDLEECYRCALECYGRALEKALGPGSNAGR